MAKLKALLKALSKMSPAGLEALEQSPENTALSGEVQPSVKLNPAISDPELASLIEAWPTLSVTIKSEILKLIDQE